MIAVEIIAFIVGLLITALALRSAVRTLVLSRSARDAVTGILFRLTRSLFELRLRWVPTYAERDRIMAFFAPVSLLTLPPTWLGLVLLGFALMFWATGIPSWLDAFTVSGSSLLTLGFARGDSLFHTVLAFAEATIGLILVALLIAYLPTMYSAFSKRETAVTLLETRAGKPPSAVELLLRYHRNQGLQRLHEMWVTWETWFAEVEESHTSLAALVFFRSPQPDHSWVTAAGAVLDAAALSLSTLEIPWDTQAALCIRAGYLAFRRIADFFDIPYEADPLFPDHPISVTREEYAAVFEEFSEAGVPLKADQDQTWRDFAGWRVNYDTTLLALCRLTMAPAAPWSCDRAGQEAGSGSDPLAAVRSEQKSANSS